MRTFIVALLVACCPAMAQPQASRLQKAERLTKAIGLEGMLADIQASNLVALKERGAAVLEQLRKAGVPEENLGKLAPSLERVLVVYASSWDPKVAGRIYAEGLMDELTEDELVEAEKYYSTPAGAKASRALANSQEKALQYVKDQTSRALEPAMTRFLEEVRRVAGESKRK